MRERFLTLLVLAPEERRDALRRMILAEYRLGPLRLVPFIHSRLGVWLTLNGDAAGTLADDYAALTRELPELVAERRSSADALAWRRLSPDQRAALQTRLPAVTAQMQPQPTAGAFETAAYRRDEVATVASAGAREAGAPQPGAPTRRRWQAVARVVELSNRMTARVWDAQLLLVERLRLFWNRAMRTTRFVTYDAPRWLFVTLPLQGWDAARQFTRWLFLTLPREAWAAARWFARSLFVTLPLQGWAAARRFLRWLFVTLPRRAWAAARRFLRWLFVTLPRRAWAAARRFLRWLFVTLPRRAWAAARRFLRWLFVTLIQQAWAAARRFLRWLFVTLPRDAWAAARRFLRWLFVTLPREIADEIAGYVRWLLVTLPREVWKAACRFPRWLLVTLPREAWAAARRFLRWLFVTLQREVWDAVRSFVRWLGELVRTFKEEIMRVLKDWWERLGDLLTWALALLITPFTAAWLLLRVLSDLRARRRSVSSFMTQRGDADALSALPLDCDDQAQASHDARLPAIQLSRVWTALQRADRHALQRSPVPDGPRAARRAVAPAVQAQLPGRRRTAPRARLHGDA